MLESMTSTPERECFENASSDEDGTSVCSSSFLSDTDIRSESSLSSEDCEFERSSVEIAPVIPAKHAGCTVGGLLSLLKSVKPGSDLMKVGIPVHFLLPKSQLQLHGESVYCVGKDLLASCVSGRSREERMLAVVAWHLSTMRPTEFGRAPYEPLPGETHHVSCGNLNVFAEQVSSEPPTSALYATDASKGVRMMWWHYPVPRFCGTYLEAEVCGSRELVLERVGETYRSNCARLRFHFLPVPGADWVGQTSVECQESGLRAELEMKTSAILTCLRHKVQGTVVDVSKADGKRRVIYSISGQWNERVKCTEVATGREFVLFDSHESWGDLQSPSVEKAEKLESSETVYLWRDVTAALLRGDWGAATKAKAKVEESQEGTGKLSSCPESRNFKRIDKTVDVDGWLEQETIGWVWNGESKYVSIAPLAVPRPKR